MGDCENLSGIWIFRWVWIALAAIFTFAIYINGSIYFYFSCFVCVFFKEEKGDILGWKEFRELTVKP